MRAASSVSCVPRLSAAGPQRSHEHRVRVVVIQRIAERRGIEPGTKDLAARHLPAVERDDAPKLLLQRIPRRLGALDAVAPADPRLTKRGVCLVESRPIGLTERTAHRNREPLVAFEPAVVADVAIADLERLGGRRRQGERVADVHRVAAEGPEDL